MKKGEMKQYLKDHKKEILLVAGGALLLGAGAIIGWQGCKKIKIGNGVVVTNEPIKTYIIDAATKYSNKVCTFCVNDEAFGIDDLGKLGENIKNLPNWNDELKFTHFIGIGPEIKVNE